MNDAFKTQCGRSVHIHGVYFEHFARGIYAGEPDVVRHHVMDSLSDRVRDIFPAKSGVFIAPCPDGDDNPTWIFVCELQCVDPVSPSAHYSALTCCWFADDIAVPISQFVAPLIAQLDWTALAMDAHY